MRKDVFGKGMILGIIFLFVGAGVVPCAISEVSNINETLYVYAKAPLWGDGSREHPFNDITTALTTLTMHPDKYGIIEVWEGTYEESGLNIPMSMTLKGNGSDVTIIDGRNSDYIIELRQDAGGTVISGFSIENSAIGIKIHNQFAEPITINNCNIKNNEKGIYVFHSYYHIIKENIIMENDLAGIYMENSDGNIVSKNKILENGNIQQPGSGGGIYMDRSVGNKIEYNEVSLNNDGIHLERSSGEATIRHNDVVCNHNHGIYMYQSNECHINKNNIYGNYVHGVHCYECSDTDATENFWGKQLGPRVWFGIGGEGKGEILSWAPLPLIAYFWYHVTWMPVESEYIDH